MSYQEVMAHQPESNYLKELIRWPMVFPTYSVLALIVIGFGFLGIVWVAFNIKLIKDIKTKLEPKERIMSIIAFLVVIGIAFVPTIIAPFFVELHDYDKWSKNYIMPYIKSQETLKSKMNHLSLNENSDGERTADIIFSHRGNMIEERDIPLKLDLKHGENPYVTYKFNQHQFSDTLTNNDENWFEKGAYEVKLHLPYDYQFK